MNKDMDNKILSIIKKALRDIQRQPEKIKLGGFKRIKSPCCNAKIITVNKGVKKIICSECKNPIGKKKF